MIQKNILLILTDQHRLSGVGAYGPTPCQTPNIDRLAAEGVLFERTYTTCPVCSPARASIYTGMYPHTHGVTTNIRELGCAVHGLEDRPTLLPRRLQSLGYQTGYLGKWHLGTERRPTYSADTPSSLPKDFGFTGQSFAGHGGAGYHYPEYRAWLKGHNREMRIAPWREQTQIIRRTFGIIDLPSEFTVPAFLVDSATRLLEQFSHSSSPFFLSLNFWGPHAPYHTTSDYLEEYRDKDIPPWPNYDWDSRNTPGPHHYKIHWNKEALTWDDWAMAVRYYYARISMIDDQIGHLLATLEQYGLLDNTAILFSADHGETLGSHGGLLDKGWHHFEETHRIPLIIRMPGGTPAGKQVTDLASLADIYPTILDLAGSEEPDFHLQGHSLVPHVHGQSENSRAAVFSEFLGLGNLGTCMKTVRTERWKYGYNLTFEDELYDLRNDPHETVNLALDSAHRSQIEEMKSLLERWMVATKDPVLKMFRWHQRIDPRSRS